jgi:hypothetical protein
MVFHHAGHTAIGAEDDLTLVACMCAPLTKHQRVSARSLIKAVSRLLWQVSGYMPYCH